MRLFLSLALSLSLAWHAQIASAQSTTPAVPAASAPAKKAQATPVPTASPEAIPKPTKAEKTPRPKPTPKAERQKREPAAEGDNRKGRGIFGWLFGGRKEKEAVSPSPTPTPTPAKRTVRPKPTAPPEAAVAEPETTPRVAEVPPEVPEDDQPKPKSPPALKTEQAPGFVPSDDSPPKPPVRPSLSFEEEDRRFEAARMKAQDDGDVVAAREESEKAATGAAYHKARQKYYELLFEKMRDLEPDLADRIRQTEQAALERLERRKDTMTRILETGAGVPVPAPAQ